MLRVVENEKDGNPEARMSLDEIAHEGARRMLSIALQAEVAEYVGAATGQRDEEGHALVVRNGTAPPRQITTGAGTMEVLPILYLRGLSTGDFREALPVLLGEKASGLSATSITRLTAEWQADYDAFRKRDLSAEEFIYVWVDGVHFRVRLEEDRLCTLVVLGVRHDGTKELLAVEDGYRESSESWS